METRKCIECGQEKEIDKFLKSENLKMCCRTCRKSFYDKTFYNKNSEIKKKKVKDYQEKNKEFYDSYRKEYSKNYQNSGAEKQYRKKIFLERMLYRAELRSVKKNWEFNLTLDYLKQLWDECDGMCEVLKIKMIPVNGKGGKLWECPSLDRIDSTKGYIKGNVKIISYRANTLKSNATLDEIQNLLDYMKKYSGENK